MRKIVLLSLVLISGPGGMNARAAEHYTIDTTGMHAFVTFRIKHLGYSWLEGRFNHFSGEFDYDEAKPSGNHVTVEIEVDSVDTNHAERDKHLRSARFFDTDKFPKAGFVSTAWEDHGNGKATLKGKFTLRGVTKISASMSPRSAAARIPGAAFVVVLKAPPRCSFPITT